MNIIKWNRTNSKRISTQALVGLSKSQNETESNLMRVAKPTRITVESNKITKQRRLQCDSVQKPRMKTKHAHIHTEPNRKQLVPKQWHMIFVVYRLIRFCLAQCDRIIFLNCTRRENNVHTNTSTPSKCH